MREEETLLNLPITFPIQAIKDFCQRWNVSGFALFGSVLRQDFGAESDVDVLVSFDKSAKPTLFHMVTMAEELWKPSLDGE